MFQDERAYNGQWPTFQMDGGKNDGLRPGAVVNMSVVFRPLTKTPKTPGHGSVTVLGAVTAQGRYPLGRGDRLLDAIRMAQGFADLDGNRDAARITIFHRQDNQPGETITFDLRSLLGERDPEPDLNVPLADGDTIVVERVGKIPGPVVPGNRGAPRLITPP